MTNTQQPLRMLIAGGGTGGHVLPAIAVIDELRDRGIPLELLWVGGHTGVEKKFAADRDIPFKAIQTGKVRRYLSLENVKDALRLPIGIVQAWGVVRGFKPDLIFSTGGNVSVPTVISGHRFAPVLTHEQTAQVGLANKLAARFADRFACSYEETAKIARTMHKSVVVTGNPVRASLKTGSKERGLQTFGFSGDLPVLFVTGGARGASAINERVEAMLPGILEVTQIIHQTGPADANPDFPRLQRVRESLPEHLRDRYAVRDMIGEEMPDIYAMADLVIGRAGAGTVAELCFTGTPAIIIPLGGTWGDEQRKNAAIMGNADAAIVAEQAETDAGKLESIIRELMADPDRRQRMSVNASALGRGDAAANVADELLALAGS